MATDGLDILFHDLSAAPAMAVRSLGLPRAMSFISRSVTTSWQTRLQKEGELDVSSMVNFVAIIVRRSGETS
jgi:hypothetical protein